MTGMKDDSRFKVRLMGILALFILKSAHIHVVEKNNLSTRELMFYS